MSAIMAKFYGTTSITYNYYGKFKVTDILNAKSILKDLKLHDNEYSICHATPGPVSYLV